MGTILFFTCLAAGLWWKFRPKNLQARPYKNNVSNTKLTEQNDVFLEPVNKTRVSPVIYPKFKHADQLTVEKNDKLKRMKNIELIYTNTRDMTHKRLIQPYKTRANIDYFEAFCFLENKKRSFCFYRIEYAIDQDTGELLSQADVYKLIHPKRTLPDWLQTEAVLGQTRILKSYDEVPERD